MTDELKRILQPVIEAQELLKQQIPDQESRVGEAMAAREQDRRRRAFESALWQAWPQLEALVTVASSQVAEGGQ